MQNKFNIEEEQKTIEISLPPQSQSSPTQSFNLRQKYDEQQNYPKKNERSNSQIEIQQSGDILDIEWVNLSADVGFCIRGLALGSKQLLSAIIERKSSQKEIRVLEVGPGQGELVPEILKLGCHFTMIGEAHHVASIMKGKECDQLQAVSGWFPQDMPDQQAQFDFIFASRVIHCAGLQSARNLVQSMFKFLAPGGKLILETTGPCSSFYENWFDQILLNRPCDEDGYEVQIKSAEGELQTVVLLTEEQAHRLCLQSGFTDVSIIPFLMPAHPSVPENSQFKYDQMLSIVAQK